MLDKINDLSKEKDVYKNTLQWFNDNKGETFIYKVKPNENLIQGKFYKFTYKSTNLKTPYSDCYRYATQGRLSLCDRKIAPLQLAVLL